MTGSITGTAERVQDHRKGVLHEEGSLSCDKADERQSRVCPNPVLSKHVLMQSGPAHSANGTMLRQQLRAGCNDLQPDKCKTCSQMMMMLMMMMKKKIVALILYWLKTSDNSALSLPPSRQILMGAAMTVSRVSFDIRLYV